MSDHSLPSRYQHWRTRVFGITWLAYAGYYLTRKAFSVAKAELADPKVMGLTKGQLSWIEAGNSLAYAVGQFTWGLAGDRWGARVAVLVGMAVSIVAAALCGWTTGAAALGVLLIVQGFAQASGWAPLAKNVGEFFSQAERGKIMGFWCTNYALGGFIASVVAGSAVGYLGGWRAAFWVSAGLLAVIWVLFLLLQRNRPEDVGLPPIEAPQNSAAPVNEGTAPTLQVLAQVLRIRMVLLLAAVYFLVKPTRYFMIAWSPLYVKERFGLATSESAWLSGMFDLAGPLGTLLGGWLSDRVFGSRRMPMAVAALFLLAIFLAVFPFLTLSRITVGASFFVIGFFIYIPDSLVSGTAAIDFGTKQGASTASGFINGCGSLGQVLGVTLPGLVGLNLAKGGDAWTPCFLWLSAALACAGALLLPQWNRLPNRA